MKARHKAMTEEMKIRLMESRDVEAVECLEKQCFSDPWSGKLLLEGLNRQKTDGSHGRLCRSKPG